MFMLQACCKTTFPVANSCSFLYASNNGLKYSNVNGSNFNAYRFTKKFSTNTSESVVEVDLTHLQDHKGIAVISFNRAAVKNAIGKVFLSQFQQRIEAVRNSKDVLVTIIRSVVPGVFCAGADLKERAEMNESQTFQLVMSLNQTFQKLAKLPVPTIAAINGSALGGGLEIALACDIRVASSNSNLGLPETKLAIIPGAGGTQRLPRIIGIPKAKELIFTGKILNGTEALSIGLLNHVTQGDPYDKALEIAKEIISKGPLAIKNAKEAIDHGIEHDLETGLLIEQRKYANVLFSKDRREGLQAFKEKRSPNYNGD